MKQVLYVQIIFERPIKNKLTLKEERQVPTHFLSFKEYETRMVRVDFTPGLSTFDHDLFKKMILKSLKRHYGKVVKMEFMDDAHGLT